MSQLNPEEPALISRMWAEGQSWECEVAEQPGPVGGAVTPRKSLLGHVLPHFLYVKVFYLAQSGTGLARVINL